MNNKIYNNKDSAKPKKSKKGTNRTINKGRNMIQQLIYQFAGASGTNRAISATEVLAR